MGAGVPLAVVQLALVWVGVGGKVEFIRACGDQIVTEVFGHGQSVSNSQRANQPFVQMAAVRVALSTDDLSCDIREKHDGVVAPTAGGGT